MNKWSEWKQHQQDVKSLLQWSPPAQAHCHPLEAPGHLQLYLVMDTLPQDCSAIIDETPDEIKMQMQHKKGQYNSRWEISNNKKFKYN